jgi:type IV secretion system protein VirD4
MDLGSAGPTLARAAVATAAGGVAITIFGLRRQYSRAIAYGVALTVLGVASLYGLHRTLSVLPDFGTAAAAAAMAASALLVPRAAVRARALGRGRSEIATGRIANAREIRRWMAPCHSPGAARLLPGEARAQPRLGGRARSVRGALRWPPEDRAKHILVIGQPGSGKTSQLILPLVYNDCRDRRCSTIVVDTKGEFWPLAEIAGRAGKALWRFKPTDLAETLAWNPIDGVERIADAQSIAAVLVRATGATSATEPFWDDAGKALLAAIIWGLRSREPRNASLGRVYALLQNGPAPLADWLRGDPETRLHGGPFIAMAESADNRNATTLLTTLSTRLQVFSDPSVAGATASPEIDLSDLAHRPVFWVIDVPEHEMLRLRPLVNLCISEIVRRLIQTAHGGRLSIPIGIVIDEFASAVGRIEGFESSLNTVRSRGISVVAAIQSLALLETAYGTAHEAVRAAFGSQIFFPHLESDDARVASEKSGLTEVEVDGATASRAPGDLFQTSGTSRTVQARPVFTPDEVRNTDGLATVFLPETRAFQMAFCPWYAEISAEREISACDKCGPSIRANPLEQWSFYP